MTTANIPILEGFPPQSWDLNVIENCWGMLMQKFEGRRPRTLRGFKAVVREAWDQIPQSSINKLVDSWDQRVRAVVQNDGAWPC